jgi:EAL domain-containing protein (putative c-di-GMP-specific phosphodiesterase class I)
VFQPQIRIDDASIHGVEALLRWERDGSLVSPDRFIEIAEEIGVIGELGHWVLEAACERLVAWRAIEHAPHRVAVNVSGRQLVDPGFADEVEEVLTRYGIRPGELELEITESVMLDATGGVLSVLDRLAARGVRLAIDDFGTGYSSLTYLRRLPVHVVKIDKSFITALGTDQQDSTIVAAIVGLSHALGLEVVAEGVEDPGHLSALFNLSCDIAQGYLFSPPVPEARLLELLADSSTLRLGASAA